MLLTVLVQWVLTMYRAMTHCEFRLVFRHSAKFTKTHYEFKMEENENVENISINNIADIKEL